MTPRPATERSLPTSTGPRARALAGSLLAALAVAAMPGPAHAGTYTVTSCSPQTGPGTLTNALASLGDETIVFAVPCATIELCPAVGCATPFGATTFEVHRDVTILGPGADSLAIVGGGDAPVLSIVGADTDVTISGLTIRGGGIYDTAGESDPGGGIRNEGNLILDSCVVRDNTGWQGGGIYNGGTLTVLDSTISDNVATPSSLGGGGIFSTGNVTITGSTIANNHADAPGGGSGGGLYANGDWFAISNSTFSGNSAGLFGGAIWASVGGGFGVPASTISNSTISGNSTVSGAALHGSADSNLVVTATIFANAGSSPFNCFLNVLGQAFDFQGAGTYNLADDASCAFSGTGNLNNTAAGLDAAGLQDNGGPTETVNLTTGSSAIGQVSHAGSCPAFDQRGAARSVPCDIGAVEFEQPVSGPTPVVSGVAPSSGYVTGGLIGVVTGAGFTGATGVRFGSTPATDVVVSGDRSMSFTIPAAASAGVVDVTVLGPGGAPSATNPAARYRYHDVPVPVEVGCVDGVCPYASTAGGLTMNATGGCNICVGYEVEEQIGGTVPDGFFVNPKCPSGLEYDTRLVKFNVSGMSSLSSLNATLSAMVAADGKPIKYRVCYTGPVNGMAAAGTAGEESPAVAFKRCNKTDPVPPCIIEIDKETGDVSLMLPTEGGAFAFGSRNPLLKKFVPTSGAVGSTLVVSGRDMGQVVSVVVGGVEAPIVERKKSKLTVTVPAGAQTGPVSVTGDFGAISSEDDFVVVP